MSELEHKESESDSESNSQHDSFVNAENIQITEIKIREELKYIFLLFIYFKYF